MPKCTYGQAHEMATKKVGEGFRTGEWQYECWIDNRLQFKVTVPDAHGKNTDQIPQGTLSSIRRQLNLDTSEFSLWRDCTMSKEQYQTLMRIKLGLKSAK